MSTSETESGPKKKSSLIPKLVGLVVFVGAVASVFLIDWKKEVEEDPVVVRPIKTTVIGDAFAGRDRIYPGKVGAGQQVDLSFEVPGTIRDRPLPLKPLRKGERVKKGDLLMLVDDSDYRNQLKAAEAERDRAQEQYDRMVKAAATGAVSDQEVKNAEAARDQAQANVDIKQKALDDTGLRAKFDGRIGDIFVNQFQSVQAKQPVLSLNDTKMIEIDVSVPEVDAANAREGMRDKLRIGVIFDYFPDAEPLPATVKEVATEADPATQTYTVTLELPRYDEEENDILPGNILPGMTATVTFDLPDELEDAEPEGFAVRVDAVPVDGLGQYFVWKLKETGSGTYTVHRAKVDVGEIVKVSEVDQSGEIDLVDKILVVGGLAKGERIAMAGVHVLTEGREVRLLDSEADSGKPAGEDKLAASE